MAGVWERILVASTDGGLAADATLVRFSMSARSSSRTAVVSAAVMAVAVAPTTVISSSKIVMGYAREALRQALVNLEAIPAPAGTLPVVLGSGWSGVLLHEAVGHGLRAISTVRAVQPTADAWARWLRPSFCTIVDDGTPGRASWLLER